MNEYVAKITLDLNCQATPIVISAGQYDIGRQIKISLTADGEAYDATGATAVCKGKSGSNYFAVNATVSKNIVTVTTDKAMLSSAGRTVAKIVLTDGTRTYSTQLFVINTHSDYDGDITASDYYPELLDILSRVIALTESGAVLTDTALDDESINPVQNKVLANIINNLTESKADKATTLAGYGILDAYTKDTLKKLLAQKLTAMPFDDEPILDSPHYLTSGAVYNSLLNKVNKSTTLAGYGILDAYTKAAIDALLADKANSSDVKASVKTLSTAISSKADINAVNALNEYVNQNTAAINGKYDSSNIEVGKGELTPAQTIYDGYEGSFNYSKIGKTVTVALNITTLIAGKNYVQFAGLPFRAMTASKLSSIAVYTTANKLVNIRLDGSWLYISSPGTTFADGEKINAIITYIIG